MNTIQFNSGHIIPGDSMLFVEPLCKILTNRELDVNLGVDSVDEPYLNIKDALSISIEWKAHYLHANDKVMSMIVGKSCVEVGGISQSLAEFINNPNNIKAFELDEAALRYFNGNIERFMQIHTRIMEAATAFIPSDVDVLLDGRHAPTANELQADLLKKLTRFKNVLGEGYQDGEDWMDGYGIIGNVSKKDDKDVINGFLELSTILDELNIVVDPESLAKMMEVPYVTVYK